MSSTRIGLLALRGRPPAVDSATAEVVAYDLYGLTARATPLDGERDCNFQLDTSDGRRLVLKFIDHEADDVVVDGQSAALAHIAEQNPLLPVPRVVATRGGELVGIVSLTGGGNGRSVGVGVGDDTAVSCRVRLVTYLPGRLMQDARAAAAARGNHGVTASDVGVSNLTGAPDVPGARASAAAGVRAGLLRSAGTQIAHLDRALVGFFHPALAQPIAWDVRRAPALLPVLVQIQSPELQHALGTALDPLQQLLQRMRGLRSQAIHGDCHGRNLLVNEASDACAGVIDLGDMIHAPLVLEIAVTMAEFLTDGVASLDELPELLAGYTSVQPLERADVDVLYELMAARIAIGVLIQAWREQNSPTAAATDLATASAAAFETLASRGKEKLTQQWLDAAGIASTGATPGTVGTSPSPGSVGTSASLGGVGTSTSLGSVGTSTTPGGVGTSTTPGGVGTSTTPGGVGANATPVNVGSGGVGRGRPMPADLVRRRQNALGANAELSYDQPLHLVRGEGVWVYTSDAERLLDVYNNVPHVGHAHPAVVAAIANQAKRIASNTRYLDTRIIEYVERLTATLPPDLDACLFVNSGSEANDIAWRMAKWHTGHEGALVMKFAYHGITDAVTALSPAICANVPPHVEQLAAPDPSAPAVSHTTAAASSAPTNMAAPAVAHTTAPAPSVPTNMAATAESDVSTAIARLTTRGFHPAALIIDSALTSTGICDPPPTWIAPIAAAVRNAGGLIIGDEVQFGLGRSGSHFWGFTRRGYHPDIVTLGKPVGNGYPLGVVVTRRALLEKFQRDTGFFSTFGGNPVAAAAGLAVLDVLDKERLVENARMTGDYFIRRLKELAQTNPAIRDVRGAGLMIGVELTDRATTKRVVNGLRERGVLTGSEGPLGNVLKLRPPMPFHMEHVEIAITALTSTLSAVRP